MKFLAAALLLVAFAALTLAKPTEVESLEPANSEPEPHSVPVVPREKRGLLYGAYNLPLTYGAAYTAPITYGSAYTYPYAYSAYSSYPYYSAGYPYYYY